MRSIIFGPNSLNGNAAAQAQGGIRRVSSVINPTALVANTAVSVTIPAGTEWVELNACNSAGTGQIPYFVCDASIATAVLPTGTITTGLGSEFMPTGYNVRGIATLSVISPVAGYLIVSAYSSLDNTSAT